ncbi:hemicentin-1 [Caerostris darwini]|uniref:Hemicentin-1 n=1 Tax=Caerostris darwini TaxID=1538125 RepID=A0AAV4VB36_9ARAC|nr:hemicentin-1 [Caerostris darwini]
MESLHVGLVVIGILSVLLPVSLGHMKDSPKIRKFSFQNNVLEGEIVSVTCFAVTKLVPVSYTWLKNGKSVEKVQNIRLSNTEELSSIILDPVTLDDSGNYTCKASNSAGGDAYTTSLLVKAHPRWVSVPNDVVSTLGSSVSVHCIATGSPEPNIIWKKYSVQNKSDYITIKTEDSGRNNSVLRIPSVSYEDAGRYECAADNGISPTIQANFTIILRADLPKIKKFSFEDNIKQGDVASVMCFATSSQMPIAFQWEKDGRPITEKVRHAKVEDGSSHSVLAFHSVELSDHGNYSCIATNIEGSDKYTAELSVKAPPRWLEEPKSIVTRVGESINIHCSAAGSPKPNISWKKISNNEGEVVLKHSEDEKSSLEHFKIASVSSSDAGNYQCIADNGIEPIIKSNFTITIRGMVHKKLIAQ